MSRSAAEQAITSLSLSLCPESATSQFSHYMLSSFFFPQSFIVYLSLSLSSSCFAAGDGERFILTFMVFCQYLRCMLMLAHTCCFLLVDVLYSLSSVVGVDLPDCLEIWLASIFGFLAFISNRQTILFAFAYFTFFFGHSRVLVIWQH